MYIGIFKINWLIAYEKQEALENRIILTNDVFRLSFEPLIPHKIFSLAYHDGHNG